MIEVIFTLDYEIYGNGTGELKQLVYDPAVRLIEVFRRWDARFVAFVEVAEVEQIEAWGTDRDVKLVRRQIQQFERDGFEVGLHLHPQWYNAHYDRGRWSLDYSEYNLCTLPAERIVEIVDRAMAYLRHVLRPQFTPLSFRAGNWLFQPTRVAAEILGAKGLKIDSSVFKGGVQHSRHLDYRRALTNGDYWPFKNDVNEADSSGPWLEIPIYTEMVPFWRMATSKRLELQKKSASASRGAADRLSRIRDLLRFKYPLKLDFCRMTLDELTSMIDGVIRQDRDNPAILKPVVAIGHTKDLIDVDTVDAFLSFLEMRGIRVSTFAEVHQRLLRQAGLELPERPLEPKLCGSRDRELSSLAH